MAIPPREQMTGDNVSESQFKNGMNNIVDFLTDAEKQSLVLDTEAQLQIFKPEVGRRAKTLDSGKVWQWDGVKWHDTGLSELDQANEFTSKKSKQLSSQITNIQSLDFHTKPNSENSWQGLDALGNVLIAVDAEGNFQQNYHYDFHTQPEKPTLMIVDKNMNIITPTGKSESDYDFNGLSYSSINPIILKDKEPYLSYSQLCIQQDFTDDLYTKDSFEIFKKHTDVYAFYDALQTQHKDRITSEVLGHDGLGNEIKQYTYTPFLFEDDGANGWTSKEMQPLKLVITTGVHGSERDSILQLAILFNEILNRTNEIEQAAFLSQFQIVIVPMICPNGFDANTRENHNGVNINRNAPAGWSKWENGTSGQFAADQAETQIACSLPLLHSDAAAFVDFHNYNYGIHRAGWYGTAKEETLQVIKRVAMKVQLVINKDFTYLKDKPIRIAKNADGTTCLDWQQTNGKKGYLIETPLFGGTQRPLFENRQYGLFVIRAALTEIMKHEIGA